MLILSAMILEAIVLQFVLYKVSPLVKNEYGWKQMLIGIGVNIGIVLAFYFLMLQHINFNLLSAARVFLVVTVMSILVSDSIIDFKYQEIPNEFNLVTFILGVVFVILNGFASGWAISFAGGWVGLLIGGGACFLLFLLLYLFTGGKVGMGDIKLVVGLGLFMGISQFAQYLMVSFFSGAVISLILLAFKIKKKDDMIAFGPYLCLGYIVVWLGIF